MSRSLKVPNSSTKVVPLQQGVEGWR